jgi:hypothetical protein
LHRWGIPDRRRIHGCLTRLVSGRGHKGSVPIRTLVLTSFSSRFVKCKAAEPFLVL